MTEPASERKRCSKCKKRKVIGTEIYQNPDNGKVDSWCRECKNNDKASRRALEENRSVDWDRLADIRAGLTWRDPERRARYNRIHHLGRHGLTLEGYEETLASQGGGCAACGSRTPDSKGRLKVFPVDHDHSCCPGEYSCGRCIRGLLCVACNTTAGLLESERVAAVAAYLERVRHGSSAVGVAV
jgi:hypothetical protein